MINLFIANAIAFALLNYLGVSLLNKRSQSKLNEVIFYIMLTTLLVFLNEDKNNKIEIINTLYLTIGYLFYIIYAYKSSLIKIIMVLASFMICNSIGEILAATIINVITSPDASSSRLSFQFTMAIILSGIITLLLLKLSIKIIRSPYWKTFPEYTWIVTILPLTIVLLILNIDDYFYLVRNNKVLIIILMGLLLSNFIIVYVSLKIVSYLEIKRELEIVNSEKQYSEFKFKVLDQQFKTNFIFMHDTVRSIMKIENLLDHGDVDVFKQELLKLNEEMMRGLNIVNSNSSIISPIINFRLRDMLYSRIDFQSVLEYTDFNFMNIFDQSYILDTLLDVGIEQCNSSYLDEKLIILKTKQIQQQIIIQLLCSHGSFSESSVFVEKFECLSETIKKNNGLISFELTDSLSNTDSLIIIFNML